MADSSATTGGFDRAKPLTGENVGPAVDAYTDDPGTTAFPFGDGYRFDRTEAVCLHEWIAIMVDTKDATAYLKRTAIQLGLVDNSFGQA